MPLNRRNTNSALGSRFRSNGPLLEEKLSPPVVESHPQGMPMPNCSNSSTSFGNLISSARSWLFLAALARR
jgi:hypothetical protein